MTKLKRAGERECEFIIRVAFTKVTYVDCSKRHRTTSRFKDNLTRI